jgi:hypothetical protein
VRWTLALAGGLILVATAYVLFWGGSEKLPDEDAGTERAEEEARSPELILTGPRTREPDAPVDGGTLGEATGQGEPEGGSRLRGTLVIHDREGGQDRAPSGTLVLAWRESGQHAFHERSVSVEDGRWALPLYEDGEVEPRTFRLRMPRCSIHRRSWTG